MPMLLDFAGSANRLAVPTTRSASTASRIRRLHDPYLKAISRQRKAANEARQKQLVQIRRSSLGDPVRSKPTPFVQKLEAFRRGQVGIDVSSPNYYLTRELVQRAYEKSYTLTSPLTSQDRETADPQVEAEAAARHEQEHLNAMEAMNRIMSLANGNTKDRLHVNTERCIETFGRHNTDKKWEGHNTDRKRMGRDAGSSEVQIAILTEKIANLCRHLATTNKDRHNKRNLRLLVHKRQKLLKYLCRQDRGGRRWQHVVETLGLWDASWKGEISL